MNISCQNSLSARDAGNPPAATLWQRGPGKAAAFTLVEVLLAIAVSAAVLVAIGGVLFSALRLRAATIRVLDESQPIDRALTVMTRDLRNMVPPGGTLFGPLQTSVFTSTANGVEGIQFFTTTAFMTDTAPWGEVQRVSYLLQPPTDASAEGQDLIRSVTRNLLPIATEDTDDQILVSGISHLEFSYFDGRNWLDFWNTGTVTNMPYAVRVRMQLARNSSRQDQPIELIVPLLALGRTNYIEQIEGEEVGEDENEN